MMRAMRFPADITRRTWVHGALAAAAFAINAPALARTEAFPRWDAQCRSRPLAQRISEHTYDRVMNPVEPDTSVYALDKAQPEFTEQMWQYINRRCSKWRVNTGKERA